MLDDPRSLRGMFVVKVRPEPVTVKSAIESCTITIKEKQAAAWSQLFQLQFIATFLFLGFAPIGDVLRKEWGPQVLFPFASVYGGTLLFVQNRAIVWKRPWCGRPFLRKGGRGFAAPYRSRCGSCGLRHGATGEDIGHD